MRLSASSSYSSPKTCPRSWNIASSRRSCVRPAWSSFEAVLRKWSYPHVRSLRDSTSPKQILGSSSPLRAHHANGFRASVASFGAIAGLRAKRKTSRVCVLYVRDTVDEAIYEREDWNKLIGLDRNRYFTWDPPAEAVELGAPPRAAIPTEGDIDTAALALGDEWPGRYDGEEFSSDSLGNVSSLDGRIAVNPQDVPETVIKLKGQPGRFKVTPQQQLVLVLMPGQDGGWIVRFGGPLAEPFSFVATQASARVDASGLYPGDLYDGPLEPAQELRFRRRRAGVVAMRRRRGGEVFASGNQAETLVDVLRRLNRTHGPISKFFVNELGHAFWREKGTARFIIAEAGNLFPVDEHAP